MGFGHKTNYTRKGTICKYFFAVEKAEKNQKLEIKMINKNLKIGGKSGFLGFILKWDVGFWIKNGGWWVKLGGLGKTGKKKMEKNEEK